MRSDKVIYWVVLSLAILSCDAVIPDAVIDLFSSFNTDLSAPTLSVFASTALYGPRLHFRNPAPADDGSNPMPIILPPDDNALLCNEPSSNATSSLSDYILLIPKGGCTYKRKVYHAELLGAQHAIIHATLASEYNSLVENPLSQSDTTYPIRRVDYECENGKSYIPETQLKFDIFPYDPANDDLLSGRDNNLCAIYHNLKPSNEKRFENTCQSQRCVFTGNKTYVFKDNIFWWESCCAWDLYSVMGDNGLDKSEVNISSSFLTMEEGDKVLQLLKDGSVTAIVFARWYPPVNFSSVLVSLIAILTIWIASRVSTLEYNNVRMKLEAVDISEDENAGDSENPPVDNVAIDNNGRNEIEDASSNAADVANNAVVEEQPNSTNDEHQRDATSENFLSNAEESSERSRDGVLDEIHEREEENAPLQVAAPPQNNNVAPLGMDRNFDEEIVQEREIDFLRDRLSSRVTRLLAFVALLGLVFIVLTRLLDILIFSYGIAGSLSVVHLLLHPGCQAVVDRIACLKPCRKPLCALEGVESLGIVTTMVGLGVGTTWLGFVFSNTMAHTHPFYWIVQDIMNFALCIVVLNSIRPNSIKIPAAILVVSFIYNSTAIFEEYKHFYQYDDGFERIKETGEDYLRCEKYAGTDMRLRCNPFAFPFAFVVIPRVNDFRGGFSVFRSVDILLPGLLCTFIARYDMAKNIVKALDARERAARRGIRHPRDLIPKKKGLRRFFSGYHYQTIIGYSIALVISSAVLAFTRDRQYVLLYVVPLTLGPVVIRGIRRSEFTSLWVGPRRFHLSNLLVSIIARGGDRAIIDLGFGVGESDTVGTMSVVSFSDSEIEWNEEEEEAH